MHTQTPIDARLAGLQATVPSHVVYRVFTHETVVLNLDTGLYHGLNPVAGQMLASLEQHGEVLEAAKQLAAEYSEPLEQVAADLLELCQGLAERGLIQLEAGSDR